MAAEAAQVRVTVLVDNLVRERKLWGEHGLSLLVETNGRKILFDSGQSGEVLIHNSRELGLNLEDVDSVVLSHGHYDHTGGLASLLKKARGLDLYAHPEAFERKYVKTDENKLREAGCPLAKEKLLASGAKLHLGRKPTWLCENTLLSGEIVGTTDFEDVPREFLVQRGQELVTDLILDDQSMGIRTSKGLVVILGCSHVGVINTIKRMQKLTATEGVHAVIGGMHLEKASMSRIQLTIHAFIELGIEKVIPLHCTGFTACAEMARVLGQRFTPGSVGATFQF
ncbi:MAG: 7,8-dihydropterin-6-yl-methyl-4-(beta-D-ribofuranosyl)aminobenzene 5-phosphate synthase [Bacillota bacterium]|nr:7,8-dihydropterin-6-yl-methyl-4-(beta-D-ribofuranosyl)aminobenzene 5-phosphate synthase [Bacillota bacterium]